MHPMLNIAVKAARRAGQIINRASLDLDLVQVSKKQHNDFVTEVDKASEAAIIETLTTAYPPYSDERDAFELALYGTSETLKIDGEGRVILSDALKDHAGITEAIAFVGLGHKFQIWEPGRFRAQLAEATGTVRALKKQLGSRVAARDAQKARE